ncbi:unnamed protein product [Oikopleura dioica]|uniref:Signal recognition particle 14 kDa protein n=1 Tax=Oikopleura dioica TaxID=34765 RepID=E4X753_OIKDI|nr:unnamed protein product [Oikopleura dioica]
MVFLEREKFLSSMTRIFQSNREGTVRMSVKPYDGQDRPTPKDGSKAKWSKEKLVLIRLTTEKEKISTVVDEEEMGEFSVEYCKQLRLNMNCLPKRPTHKKKKKATDN